MRLSSYVQRSPHGIYYLRVVIPEGLRAALAGRRELRRSLGTRNPHTARRWAYDVAGQVRAWLKESKTMGTPDIDALLSQMKQGRISKYKVQIGNLAVTVDPAVPGDQEGAVEYLKAFDKLVGGLEKAIRPHAVGNPAPASDTSISLSTAIREYLADFDASHSNLKTCADYCTVLTRFLNIVTDRPMATVSRQDVQRFYESGRIKKLSPRTLHKQTSIVHTFFGWARDSLHYPANQPLPTQNAFRLSKKKLSQSSRPRQPFTFNELITIFEPLGYRKYNLKQPHRFWLPLLALFTGARIEELCQLQLGDIRQDKSSGIYYLDINDHAGKTLKTVSSQRKVPLHSRLIGLGFLDYVEDVRAGRFDNDRLFPYLRANRFGRYSDSASKHFARYLTAIGITDSHLVFHSFRHSVVTELEMQRVAPKIAHRLVGHAFDEGVHGLYNHIEPSLRELADAVESLKYVQPVVGDTRILDFSQLIARHGEFSPLLHKLMRTHTEGD